MKIENKLKELGIFGNDYDTPDDGETEVLGSGADDYIKKPFSIMELITRVKALLRRTITEDIKYLQVDNLVLDHGLANR